MKKNMYAEAAVKAVGYFRHGLTDTPRKAWDKAIAELTDSPSSRDEGCPRNAFLGLCEEGLVKGIPAGGYTRNGQKLNKKYAIQALKLLLQNPQLVADEQSVWSKVAPETVYHGQVAIVISLLQHELFVANASSLLAARSLSPRGANSVQVTAN